MTEQFEQAKRELAEKWCIKVIECMKGDDYIMHAPDEMLSDLTALLEQHKEVILEFTEWTSKEGWVFHARTNTWVWHNRIGVVRKTSTELYDEYFKKAKKL